MGSSGPDGNSRNRANASFMSRTYSGPVNAENSVSLDRPMRLSEIYVAAEHALKQTISDPNLLMSLSSLQEFEVLNGPQIFLRVGIDFLLGGRLSGCLK